MSVPPHVPRPDRGLLLGALAALTLVAAVLCATAVLGRGLGHTAFSSSAGREGDRALVVPAAPERGARPLRGVSPEPVTPGRPATPTPTPAPAPAARPPAATPRRTAARTPAATPRATPKPQATTPAATQTPAPAGQTTSAASTSAGAPTPHAPPSGSSGTVVGGTIDDTGRGLGAVVRPVSPNAGAVVQGTTGALAETAALGLP